MSNTILADKQKPSRYYPSQTFFYLEGKLSEQQTFGEWLKAKRGRKFTQDELAEAADNICTGAYISTLERGVIAKKSGKPIRPDEAIVEALAKALGESVSEARIVAGYSPTRAAQHTRPGVRFLRQMWATYPAPPRR